jgi:hypothetical protein
MAQRTTFAKLQRERAKQAKAEAKRNSRQGKEPPAQEEERSGPPRRKTMEEMIWEEVQAEKAAEKAAKEAAEKKAAQES